MEVKLFMADVTYDNVVVQLNDKCYNDTLNNFYADYKECDFNSIRNMQHNFSSGEIIVDDEHVDLDPFQEIGLDALEKLDELLDKQDKRRNPPPATVEEAKAEKLAELSSVADNYAQYKCPIDMYIVSSTGFKVDADVCSQTNMQGLILMLPEGGTCRYKCFDNQFRTVSREQLVTMVGECKQNGLNLYNQKFAYEAQINACTTKEEVEAIKIEFKMMDFRK